MTLIFRQAKDQILANREKRKREELSSSPPLEELILPKVKYTKDAGGKRCRHSNCLSPTEMAIYTEAGKENPGFVSAKAYSQTVAQKRLLKQGKLLA